MDDDDLELVFPAFIVAARMSAAAFNCASVMLLKLLKSISGRVDDKEGAVEELDDLFNDESLAEGACPEDDDFDL